MHTPSPEWKPTEIPELSSQGLKAQAQQRLRQLIEAGLASGPATPRSAQEVEALLALAEG